MLLFNLVLFFTAISINKLVVSFKMDAGVKRIFCCINLLNYNFKLRHLVWVGSTRMSSWQWLSWQKLTKSFILSLAQF